MPDGELGFACFFDTILSRGFWDMGLGNGRENLWSKRRGLLRRSRGEWWMVGGGDARVMGF